MATLQQPSASDLNTELLVSESVPAQIRLVQSKLRELTAAHAKYSAQLRRLIELAITEDVDLCPAQAKNGNAAGPGGADGAVLGGRAPEGFDLSNLSTTARGGAR